MTQQEMYKHMAEWAQFQRRHKANVFNAFFYDKESISEEDIEGVVEGIAKFFDLPLPQIYDTCDTFAKILTSPSATECELHYNIKMLTEAGINNKDAFTMCFVHELSHQLLHRCHFDLFANERWVHELAADLMAGVYANQHPIATGKYKYVLSRQAASETHPAGSIRAEIVDYGRIYFEKRKESHTVLASDVLTLLPAFIYLHYDILKKDWKQVEEEVENPPAHLPKPKEVRIVDLSDSNLIKQMVMRTRAQCGKGYEDN